MKLYLSKLLLLLATARSPLSADAQVAKVCESLRPYGYDSGETRAATTEVSFSRAPWIQLDLSGTQLAGGASLKLEGEYASQVITSDDLSLNAFSAVFDGSSVSVELSTPGGIRGVTSRVLVSNVNVGLCKEEAIADSICGDVDDRIPSTDVRMGRIGGCTGWLISEDVFIQAGHCGTPSSSARIHFTFGVGNAAPEDQYAVDVSSYQGVNGGVGNDWGAGRLLPNSITGKLPGVAQSEKCGTPGCGWFDLGPVPTTTSGNNIRITGYGTAAVDSRSQKTHVGALTTIASTYVRYVPDTTGGNSGSPILHEETGYAIGVHTHGGCTSTGGSNQGTRIDKPEFAAHVESLLGAACTQDSDCDDGVFCNGVEVCNAGKCRSGTPVSCDDGLACTLNICNEAAQACDNPAKACDAPGQTGLCFEPTGQCECSDKRIEVDIVTDNYPGETTWSVTDKCGTAGVVLSGGNYGDANSPFSADVCASTGQYEFKIEDTYGDGICCSYGDGSYNVKYGGVVVASGGAFTTSETKTFGECGGTPPATPPPTPTSTATPPPTVGSTPPPTVGSTPPPTNPPTPSPTSPPTPAPTNLPTSSPTNLPTSAPTKPPTPSPTSPPTPAPTAPPTGSPTPAPSAPPTASPTPFDTSEVPTVSPDTASPQDAVFDSDFGAPRCANAGSECDSLNLLDGRGAISNGVEPNSPNTNKFGADCVDGSSGSYHSDESIDQITVTAGDIVSGSPVPSGDFIAEGGRAYVSVKVWCWNTGASDTADIYLTSDASSPDWQLLTSMPCPAGGAQTLTHAFDVPQGTNQSIRVNFRYNGSPSTCSNGSYDDHDDLIFTVKEDPNFTSPPTPAPTTPPTPMPTNVGDNGPQVASYDASLGAPKCSFGSSCDSGDSLDGRGTITNGVEPNASNTLNSCTDGNSGSYHSDESLDKIVVTRADGGDGDLTEGDVVTIYATVWCWSTGTSDYIDFYYASDASSPEWNQIGSRQQCLNGGINTITASYTLPQGGLQAVRANFMYGGGTVSSSACTSGSYDDTDDLVISVKPNPVQGATEAALPSNSKNDDVQGEIVDGWKDAEADELLKELQKMNQSDKKPKLKGREKGRGRRERGGKGKEKSGKGKESGVGGLFSE